jgi:hypothetical protein
MEELLDHLRQRCWTLTVYNHTGSESRLDAVRQSLTARGVTVRTVTDAGGPKDVCLFHQGDDLVATTTVDELAADHETAGGDPIERAFGGADPFSAVDVPFDGDPSVSAAPAADRNKMIGISREFERRAMRRRSGTIRSGFQHLSALVASERTRSVYERLDEAGIDVAVYGTPDASPDVSFEVVADDAEALADYWFVLYDSDDPESQAALVAREFEPSTYEAFWTVDPALTDDLFDIAVDHL